MKFTSRLGLWFGRRLPRGYWRVIRFVAKRDPALWDFKIPLNFFEDASLRADLREPVFTGLLRHGCIPHQRGEDELFKKLIKDGSTVFDIGANIGYVTMLTSWVVGEKGLVVAFEPSDRAFRLLERNTSELTNVKRVKSAVSTREGISTFYETASLDTSSLEPTASTKSYQVPTVNLDDQANKWGKPDFIKIDVEGHERDVFLGMRGILSGNDKPILMFEALTPEDLVANTALLADVSNEDYQVWRVLTNGKVGQVENKLGTSNYIAFPSSQLPMLSSVKASAN